MGMTRKDYTALAAALRDAKPDMPDTAPHKTGRLALAMARETWMTAVRGIADALAADNPRFDRQRFYAAAGMPS